jgi:hypothetical protein
MLIIIALLLLLIVLKLFAKEVKWLFKLVLWITIISIIMIVGGGLIGNEYYASHVEQSTQTTNPE